MSEINKQTILEALQGVRDPKTQKDIVTLGWVGNVDTRFGNVSITLHAPKESNQEDLRSVVVGVVKQIPGVQAVLPSFSKKPPPRASRLSSTGDLSRIQNIIAIGSGKGGVGKSTSAVNIALGVAQKGYKVGLLDADIYGPSVPTMLAKGLESTAGVKTQGEKLIPFEMYGIKVISLAMLIDKNQPTVWRAPIATKMIHQFLNGVVWGDLDFLFIDLPPGTGDIQLTLAQQANITGAIVVTTPQRVALNIAEKGLLMFQHLHVPILGILENMSGFACGSCGSVTPIFGEKGARELSMKNSVPVLGEIPLDVELMRSGDLGKPIILSDPQAPSAQAYMTTVEALLKALSTSEEDKTLAPLAVESIPNDPENNQKHSIAIYWTDGMKYVYDCLDLRLGCPCAGCVDELTKERKIQAKDINSDIYIEKALPVGRYGLNIIWTDGHSTGIYTYTSLRDLNCRKVKESPHVPKAHEQDAGEHARV